MNEVGLYILYREHIRDKEIHFENLLKQIGYSGFFSGIFPSPVQVGFRNRAKFRIFRNNGRIKIIGTDPIRGDDTVEKTMWILPDWGQALVNRVCDVIRDRPDKIPIDGFEVQLTHGKKSAHLTLSLRKTADNCTDELAHSLLEDTPGLKGVAVPSKGAHYGSSFLTHRICGLEINAHHTAFFQSNFFLTSILVNKVKEILKEEKKETIFDFYCGVGLFSLQVGDNFSQITGVDNNKNAIDSAKKNAETLNFKNARFTCSSVDDYVQDAEPVELDLAIINPPRSGCTARNISIIARMGPEVVCQVSCAPDTSVRDLEEWKKNGYVVQSLLAFDMFPFTNFLETAAVLKREGT